MLNHWVRLGRQAALIVVALFSLACLLVYLMIRLALVLAFDRSVPEAEVFRCDPTKWHVDARCCDTTEDPGLHSCNTAPVAQWLLVKQQSGVFWRYCKAKAMPNCCFSHPGDELQGEMFYCTEEAIVRRT